MPASWAMASRWSTAFVEPPVAATDAIAFSKAAGVRIWRGVSLRRTRSTTSAPAARATAGLPASTAGTALLPIGERPRNSQTPAIVLAVNWPPQAPAPGQA